MADAIVAAVFFNVFTVSFPVLYARPVPSNPRFASMHVPRMRSEWRSIGRTTVGLPSLPKGLLARRLMVHLNKPNNSGRELVLSSLSAG